MAMFDKHDKTGLSTLKYGPFDHVMEDIQILVTSFVLGSSSYEHYNVYIWQVYKKAL